MGGMIETRYSTVGDEKQLNSKNQEVLSVLHNISRDVPSINISLDLLDKIYLFDAIRNTAEDDMQYVRFKSVKCVNYKEKY